MSKHARPVPWQMQAVFDAVIYAVLILILFVTGWLIVVFAAWAWGW